MDTDNDGHLTIAELEAARSQVHSLKLGDTKWIEVLKNCDLDGDGKIDFSEFYTAAIDHQKVLTKENIEYAFRTFDTNGDGTLDITEFKSALPSNYRRTLYMKQNIEGQGGTQDRATRNFSADTDNFDKRMSMAKMMQEER